MDTACAVDVLVSGQRLRKHRNEHGEYVLGTPGTEYQILLGNRWENPAVVEVFVDGNSTLCPPKRTRVLRSSMIVEGFEKRPVRDERDDGLIEERFEIEPFEFAWPSTEEDRNHPELGLIRICLYDALPLEVSCGRRRRGLAGEAFENTVQPRQGKKANGPERMTTKGGDRQLTRPRTLATKAVHTVFDKGMLLGQVDLRYYNGIDDSFIHNHMNGPRGFLSRGGVADGSSSRRRDASRSVLFSGSGLRLGGSVSREVALARLANNATSDATAMNATAQAAVFTCLRSGGDASSEGGAARVGSDVIECGPAGDIFAPTVTVSASTRTPGHNLQTTLRVSDGAQDEQDPDLQNAIRLSLLDDSAQTSDSAASSSEQMQMAMPPLQGNESHHLADSEECNNSVAGVSLPLSLHASRSTTGVIAAENISTRATMVTCVRPGESPCEDAVAPSGSDVLEGGAAVNINAPAGAATALERAWDEGLQLALRASEATHDEEDLDLQKAIRLSLLTASTQTNDSTASSSKQMSMTRLALQSYGSRSSADDDEISGSMAAVSLPLGLNEANTTTGGAAAKDMNSQEATAVKGATDILQPLASTGVCNNNVQITHCALETAHAEEHLYLKNAIHLSLAAAPAQTSDSVASSSQQMQMVILPLQGNESRSPAGDEEESNSAAAISLPFNLHADADVNTGQAVFASSVSATASSRGDETCYFCGVRRTKQLGICRVCRQGRYAVCQPCLDSGIVACHKCSTDLEVATDSQLRSIEILDSSLTSSQGACDRPEQEEHVAAIHFYLDEVGATWDIEEEYTDSRWFGTSRASAIPGEVEVCSYAQSSEPGPIQLPAPNAQATASTDGVVGSWMRVAVDFDSRAEGYCEVLEEEYLSLNAGDWLYMQPELVEGWAYAFSSRLGQWGWCPPLYATSME